MRPWPKQIKQKQSQCAPEIKGLINGGQGHLDGRSGGQAPGEEAWSQEEVQGVTGTLACQWETDRQSVFGTSGETQRDQDRRAKLGLVAATPEHRGSLARKQCNKSDAV